MKMPSFLKSKSEKIPNIENEKLPEAFSNTQDLMFFVLQKLKHIVLMNQEFETNWKKNFEKKMQSSSFASDILLDLFSKHLQTSIDRIKQIKSETTKLITDQKNSTNQQNHIEELQNFLKNNENIQSQKSTQILTTLDQIKARIYSETNDITKQNLNLENEKLKKQIDSIRLQLTNSYIHEDNQIRILKDEIVELKKEVKLLQKENTICKNVMREYGVDLNTHPQIISKTPPSILKIVKTKKLNSLFFDFLDLKDFLIFTHSSKSLRFQVCIEANYPKIISAKFEKNPESIGCFYKEHEIEKTKQLISTSLGDQGNLAVQIRRFLQYDYNPTSFLVTEVKNSIDKIQKFDKKAQQKSSFNILSNSFVDKIKKNLGKLEIQGFSGNDLTNTIFDARFYEVSNAVQTNNPKTDLNFCLEKFSLLTFDRKKACESPQEYATKQNAIFFNNVEDKSTKIGQYFFELYEDLGESSVIRQKHGEVRLRIVSTILAAFVFPQG